MASLGSHHRCPAQRHLEQTRRWGRHYPRSRPLVLQGGRLLREPEVVSAALCDFLGLRPYRRERYPAFHPGNYEGAMPVDLKRRLGAFFEPRNRALYQWLGEDFDWE